MIHTLRAVLCVLSHEAPDPSKLLKTDDRLAIVLKLAFVSFFTFSSFASVIEELKLMI